MKIFMRILAVVALALAAVVAHHLSWYGFGRPQASALALARERAIEWQRQQHDGPWVAPTPLEPSEPAPSLIPGLGWAKP
jgi:hypothetical protein